MSDDPLPPQISHHLIIPESCLVLLVGPAGCGKSTFARRHFKPTEILSSDSFRGMVCDDEANQSASRDAFELLHFAAAKRLARHKLTVIDATNLEADARKPLLDLAKKHHVQTVAIVFRLPVAVCLRQNQKRSERIVEPHIVELHAQKLEAALANLEKKKLHKIYVLSSLDMMDRVRIGRQKLAVNRRDELGPFDVIGDVHGCFDELLELLHKLGYQISEVSKTSEISETAPYRVQPPPGRKAVFVGDFVDRGPRVCDVLRLVMDMADTGAALCVIGNHDDKLRRVLNGRRVNLTHGLEQTVAQLETEPAAFRERVRLFLDQLPTHIVLDRGRLVVAHAGLRRDMHGRISGEERSFALYGDTTGETDELGLPVRRDWAAAYDGNALVVYGHTPVAEPTWVNNTINIDTGCAFGGSLTALRYPEKELLTVPAKKIYCPPRRPFLPVHGAQQEKNAGNDGG